MSNEAYGKIHGFPGRKRMKHSPKVSGFTLLEVLVALSLLGIAVTVIVQLFSADLRAISASESYVNGTLEAQTKIREILESKDLSERSWGGVTENGYRFEASMAAVLPERTENLLVQLLEINVTIFWAQGPGEKSLSLKTLKVIPKKI
jgi:prepilin-type N-terminal cleavage/methylation domain-containing protein